MSETKCKSIEDQLKDVMQQLSHFEALKLTEQKTELEASAKKKQTAVIEYEKKFPELMSEWCRQDIEIEQLRQSLKCVFEHEGGWKKHIKCACDEFDKIRRLELDILLLKGKREKERDAARAAMDEAKKILFGWEGAVANIDSRLKENDKLIKEIRALAGPDQIQGVYLLWFKLMPWHSQLRPLDKNHSWTGESVAELCHEYGHDFEQNREITEYRESSIEQWPRKVPWLVKPPDYPEKIDCASADYSKMKEEYAKAESVFKSDPDDVNSLAKKLEEKYKSKDDDVKKCLAKTTPKETT